MRLTVYDWLLLRRTVALGVLFATLIFLTMLGTDELGSTNAGRLGRLAALVSLAGGGAAFVASGQARSRGEALALEAFGVTPLRASLGAVMGGVAVGLIGVVLAFSPDVDLAPLFPHALPEGADFIARGEDWWEPARGLLFKSDGDVVRSMNGVASNASSMTQAPGAVWPALASAAIAFPLWATARGPALRRAIVGFSAIVAAVVVFHLVAAKRLTSPSLLAAPLVLLVDAVALHWRRAWS